VKKLLKGIKAARDRIAGVRTFYVRGSHGDRYVVQDIRREERRGLFCTCKDFTFRRLATRGRCRHIRRLLDAARRAHGITRLYRIAA